MKEKWKRAVVLHKAGRYAEAERIYRECLSGTSDQAGILYAIGEVCYQQNKLDQAIEVLNRATHLDPLNLAFRYSLASIQQIRGYYAEAAGHFRKIISIEPGHVAAHLGLGINHYDQGLYSEAIESYSKAILLEPDNQMAHYNLALAYIRAGCSTQADASLRRALEINPTAAAIHSCFLLNLHYHGNLSNSQVLSEHCRWADLHEAPVNRRTKQTVRQADPGRRIRIAYVSPDFRRHSVASFIAPVLQAHDHKRFEIVCYSDVKNPDGITARLKTYADQWHDVRTLDDRQLAGKIHSDGIDILVDLAGHTNGNRLVVFAHKPAPIQVTYLGYPDTTGMAAMDVRLTDHWADPEGVADQWCRERLVRLPCGFLCYEPPAESPEVAHLPSLMEGRITFGSFNNLAKITPEVISAWSLMLGKVPEGRLIIKARGLDDAVVGEYLRERFRASGVTADQIELSGHIPGHMQHLQFYERVDVALDTFPYNGTTTTCEALWMGVPVITLAGNNHAGRVGLSLLSRLGLDAYVAQSVSEYIDLAIDQSGQVDKLAILRAGLRDRMLGSSVTDPEMFCRQLEAAYSDMCESHYSRA